MASSPPEFEPQRRVLKRATIVIGIHQSEITCTVTKQNKRGAELKVSLDAQIVPEELLLYVPVDGVAYRSRVVGRQGNRIQVQFLGTEPKPPYHYG
jgi:hypothetical protein